MTFQHSKNNFLPLIFIFLIYLILSLFYFYWHHWDITIPIQAGEKLYLSHFFRNEITLIKNSSGYDGIFYYAFARNPFDFNFLKNSILDPAYRYQRILYPVLTYLFSFGQKNLIPYVLFLINFWAIIFSVWFLIKIILLFQLNPWLSIFYGLFPGLILSLFRDVAEPLAFLFVILALYFYLKRKWILLALFFSLAVLTKEITLIPVIFLIFYVFVFQQRFRSQIKYLFIPPLIFIFWKIITLLLFSQSVISFGFYNFTLPFFGFFKKFIWILERPFGLALFFEMFFICLLIAIVFLAIKKLIFNFHLFNLIFFIFALMIIFLELVVFFEPASYARASLGLFLFFFLGYLKDKDQLSLIFLFTYLFSLIPFWFYFISF